MALVFVGCSQSPLLNHANASTQPGTPSTLTVNATCPLQFEKEPSLCASIEWIKMPEGDTQGEFNLKFWNPTLGSENGPYTDPRHSVYVKLFMPSMGHGSSPVQTTQALDPNGVALPGVFRASDVYFIMPGTWQIIIQLRQGSQVMDQAVETIQV